MTLSEQLFQRSDLIGTQVITRDTGKKLGVINQIWVDVDQREVVVLGLRSTLFTGEQRYMYLADISQIGDVILVEDEQSLEEADVLNYSSLIANEVITETGELLGKVRGFKFDPNNGKVTDLVIASFGLPWIPNQLISTYELPIDEIVSTNPERLIVFEGAEDRLNQLTVGMMERLGIGAPPWEGDEEDYRQPTTAASNQLGPGTRTPYTQPNKRTAPAVEENWQEEEDVWEPARPAEPPQAQRRYQDEETDNWGSQTRRSEPVARQPAPPTFDDDLDEDVWDDNYEAPKINLPERRKAPEYQQEPEY